MNGRGVMLTRKHVANTITKVLESLVIKPGENKNTTAHVCETSLIRKSEGIPPRNESLI
jgi:hypothetical protein